jgi:hypothetical protein
LVSDEVHRLRIANRGDGGRVRRIAATKHADRLDGDRQSLAPRLSGSDQPLGVLEGVGCREHRDRCGCGCGQQPSVEVVVLDEGSATLQRHCSGHGRRLGLADRSTVHRGLPPKR